MVKPILLTALGLEISRSSTDILDIVPGDSRVTVDSRTRKIWNSIEYAVGTLVTLSDRKYRGTTSSFGHPK